MKRFLIILSIGIVFSFLAFYLVFIEGFYISFKNIDTVISYKTGQKEILRKNSDGSFSPFKIKGVNISSSLPGSYARQFAPQREDYLRWLTQISQMGANTVRTPEIMDSDFYNALFEFNEGNPNPIYLIQSIDVRDSANYGYKTTYHMDFFGKLLSDAKKSVDVIHGRAFTFYGGIYQKDVSPWVLGYLVGNYWSSDAIAYTDHHILHNGKYKGKYFLTKTEATAFESMLAQVMDLIVSYETDKYHQQRIVGFVNSLENDFLQYQEMYARQLAKYAFVDAENILTSGSFNGYYAAYNVYDFSDDILSYLTEEQLQELATVLPKVNTSRSYAGYLDLISEYHTMPVIISSYGFSTARGSIKKDTAPLTELEQGMNLIKVWQDAVQAELSGVFISSWQDQWERRTWNSIFSVELDNNFRWHDLQSDGQNYGIMAFLPEEEAVCTLDGLSEEWNESDVVISKVDYTLSLRSDYQGLYILAQGEKVSQDKPVYIAFDTIDDLGSYYSSEPFVRFDSEADFLLAIDGKNNTRLLVQERYDAMRSNFLLEITVKNPYIDIPLRSSSKFVPIRMAVRNPKLVNTDLIKNVKEVQHLRTLGTWETGKLLHGNGNRGQVDFYSLTDFSFGKNCVEIRIPWQLLNFFNPLEKLIHKDYYDNYGVKPKFISKLKIGMGDGSEITKMQECDLPDLPYNRPYREVLKQSYYHIRKHWK